MRRRRQSDGIKVKFSKPGIGLLINRSAMQGDLAGRCSRLGVECDFRTHVRSLEPIPDSGHSLRLDGHEPREIRARIVIDASGPGSRSVRGGRCRL